MLQQWAELLDEFRGLPPRLKPLPTFLEFSGCKRKEEVYSDILACAVERRHSSAGANPARQLSFQPVAVGADDGGNDIV